MALAKLDSLEAIEPQESIASQLFQRLRARIIQLDFQPGQRISETEVARYYAVSRQPVREAFIKLATAGLIDIRPQRGTFVKKIEIAAVMDARFVREAIEADVVRNIAEDVDAATIAGLRAQIAHQRRIPEDDHASFLAADETFHKTLAETAGKAYAWRVVEEVKAQMDRVRYLSFGGTTSTTVLIDQHERIVDALEHGNRKKAESAVRQHLREILKSLPRIASEHPDLFDALP